MKSALKTMEKVESQNGHAYEVDGNVNWAGISRSHHGISIEYIEVQAIISSGRNHGQTFAKLKLVPKTLEVYDEEQQDEGAQDAHVA